MTQLLHYPTLSCIGVISGKRFHSFPFSIPRHHSHWCEQWRPHIFSNEELNSKDRVGDLGHACHHVSNQWNTSNMCVETSCKGGSALSPACPMTSFTGIFSGFYWLYFPIREDPPYSATDWLMRVAFLAEFTFIADDQDWWSGWSYRWFQLELGCFHEEGSFLCSARMYNYNVWLWERNAFFFKFYYDLHVAEMDGIKSQIR